MDTATLAIEPLDIRSASDAELAFAHDFFSKMRAERHPHDTPIPFEEDLARWRSLPPFVQLTSYTAWDPDHTALVALGTVVIINMEENRHLAQVELEVLPEYRQQGLGKRLLGLLAEVAECEGRTFMLIGTHGRILAGEAFMERLGAHKGLESHTNQLDLRDLDRGLLQRWLDQAASLADDFELGLWEGEYPESQMDEIAALYEVMNSQPRGTLQAEDVTLRRSRSAICKRKSSPPGATTGRCMCGTGRPAPWPALPTSSGTPTGPNCSSRATRASFPSTAIADWDAGSRRPCWTRPYASGPRCATCAPTTPTPTRPCCASTTS